MNLQFRSMPRPPASLIERVAACDPTNPFCTLEYATASRGLWARRPALLVVGGENEVVSGCVAFLSGSFLRRCLNLPSLPNVPDPPAFWRGLLKTLPRIESLEFAD